MIMTSMVAAAMSLALYGNEVIDDFSVPPWFLETAVKMITSREIPLHCVVLRPSEKICAARAAARYEGKIPDYKHYQDLYTLLTRCNAILSLMIPAIRKLWHKS